MIINHLTGKTSGCTHRTVIKCKVLRNRNLLGAAMCTVGAGCAGNSRIIVNNFCHLLNDSLFFFIQWLEIPKGFRIIHDLLQTIHATEYAEYSRLGVSPGGAADLLTCSLFLYWAQLVNMMELS